jgi:hypothetical protein
MLGGASVATTLIFTRILIQKPLKWVKIIGASAAFFGMLIVGSSTLLTPTTTFAY